MDPFGAPHDNLQGEEKSFSRFTIKHLLVRYYLSHAIGWQHSSKKTQNWHF